MELILDVLIAVVLFYATYLSYTQTMTRGTDYNIAKYISKCV